MFSSQDWLPVEAPRSTPILPDIPFVLTYTLKDLHASSFFQHIHTHLQLVPEIPSRSEFHHLELPYLEDTPERVEMVGRCMKNQSPWTMTYLFKQCMQNGVSFADVINKIHAPAALNVHRASPIVDVVSVDSDTETSVEDGSEEERSNTKLTDEDLKFSSPLLYSYVDDVIFVDLVGWDNQPINQVLELNKYSDVFQSELSFQHPYPVDGVQERQVYKLRYVYHDGIKYVFVNDAMRFLCESQGMLYYIKQLQRIAPEHRVVVKLHNKKKFSGYIHTISRSGFRQWFHRQQRHIQKRHYPMYRRLIRFFLARFGGVEGNTTMITV